MADNGIKKYRLGAPVLRRALLDGFDTVGGSVRTTENSKVLHNIFLPGIDSAEPDCSWGRLALSCRLNAESMLTVRAFASDNNEIVRGGEVIRVDDFLLDPDISPEEKEKLFAIGDGLLRSGASDILLDGQNGRWLWLWFEISGYGENELSDIRVYVPGDNFFHTLPQVYREDNSFLKRYLSVFSTMYNDFQEQINSLPELLDVDTAPDEMLPVFTSWLGLETDETLISPDELRLLLKNAPKLMERKGTRWAIEKVTSLFVSGKVYVIERNLLTDAQKRNDDMYGSTPYDFTVMVGCKMDEKLRLKLKFLIDQFKPLRSRGKIVFLEEHGGLDSFTYLDVNSRASESSQGILDTGNALTGMTYLR